MTDSSIDQITQINQEKGVLHDSNPVTAGDDEVWKAQTNQLDVLKWASFLFIFVPFQTTFLPKKTVGFSRIQTWIFGVEG